MRRFAATALLALTLLAGCSTPEPTATPGDGPATVESEFPTEPTDMPSEEPSEEQEQTGAFGDKITYPDGVEVEITKVRHGKLSQEDWKQLYEDEPAPDYVSVTVRIRNGSDARIEVSETAEVTYGPDGESASRYSDSGSLDGLVLKGKAKTATYKVYIPKKYQDDVVWVQTLDFERPEAVFVGSLSKDLN